MNETTINATINDVVNIQGSIVSDNTIAGGNIETSYRPVRLEPATKSNLGGVIVGDNIDVAGNGTISVKKPAFLDNVDFLNLFS